MLTLLFMVELIRSLTKKCIWETIPAAPRGPGQPPAAHAGREAEGGPKDADEHVAGADVDQQQVHRSHQPGETWEHHQHEEVTKEAQDQNDPQEHGCHGVNCPG